jgi:hypothetical protein
MSRTQPQIFPTHMPETPRLPLPPLPGRPPRPSSPRGIWLQGQGWKTADGLATGAGRGFQGLRQLAGEWAVGCDGWMCRKFQGGGVSSPFLGRGLERWGRHHRAIRGRWCTKHAAVRPASWIPSFVSWQQLQRVRRRHGFPKIRLERTSTFCDRVQSLFAPCHLFGEIFLCGVIFQE